MASVARADAHRDDVEDIVTLAHSDLVALWRALPLDDADATKAVLVDELPDLVGDYGLMAAGLAADEYLDARAEAGVRGRYSPTLAAVAPASQVAINARWSVGPLYAAQPDGALALRRTAGVVQRLVANADRATYLENVRRDPAGVRWYRGTSANCCAFCAMTASRGAVYRSESTASFKAHNHCRCFPVALFPGERHELPDYYDDFLEEYETAAAAVVRAGGKRTQSAVLREMRARTGRA